MPNTLRLSLVLILLTAIFPKVIKADMHYTTDPVSGLEWLNLSETANMAYNDAPTSFPGWRYATNAEIEALFSTWFPAFVPDPRSGSADSFFSPYPEINDEARGFIEAFGELDRAHHRPKIMRAWPRRGYDQIR